ncbi:hypothetical protein [uncultured Methanobrevibacter sp.]|uniref:hypothetical protein n=1 Tax=uncultured Methanobrevibacter sp. TaxID=253161 RepID=UPI0025EA9F21|nr:hypothetical protein [uncultured Methanobrevibacter sp.]
MTAIVGVLNKHGIAIAADSAVTMGDTHKVVNSGNKIFTLSYHNPIAIMTYNAADFMGVPWEIIIKQYRKHLDKKSFAHIDGYISDFIKYLSGLPYLLDGKVQHNALLAHIISFYKFHFEKVYREAKANKMPFDIQDPNTYYMLKDNMEKVNKEIIGIGVCEEFNDYKLEDFLKYSKAEFDTFFKMSNPPFPIIIPCHEREWFKKIFFNYLRSKSSLTTFTGLVFTGYGDDDIYPSLMSLRIFLFVDGKVNYYIEDERTCHISDEHNACIAPYAQSDVIQTILGGMYPGFGIIIKEAIKSSVDAYDGNVRNLVKSSPQYSGLTHELDKFDKDNLVDKVNKLIQKRMFNDYTQKLIGTVANLDKEDMANMAGSFISLTSLVRRMSPHEETVGGPVDVAVISKGDGFVWINRKHYFRPEFNPHFFRNLNN